MSKHFQFSGTGLSAILFIVLTAGCAHMPITEEGVWVGPLPQTQISVKEAARVNRPWYEKGLVPFLATIFSGSRTGMEWNEGRNLRPSELFRSIPYVGLLMIPYWCAESLSEKTMQYEANQTGIDKTRKQKYDAVIKRLEQDGRHSEAENLRARTPFDETNHPPNPAAQMPKENLDGFWNNMKIAYVDVLIGHRNALERNESRGLRKLEYWHPLLITRVYEAFEAAFGRRMEDVAEKAHLDEAWLPKAPFVAVTQKTTG